MMKSVELKAKNRAVPSSTSLPHSRILAADITSPHSQNFNLSMTKEQSCQLPSSNPGPLLCPELLECFVSGQLSPIISADLSVIQSRPLFFTLAALSYQVRTPHYLQIWPRPTFEMGFSFWGNAFNREMLTIIGANTAAFRSCLLDHQPSIIAQGQRKLGGLVWGGNRSFVILSHIS